MARVTVHCSWNPTRNPRHWACITGKRKDLLQNGRGVKHARFTMRWGPKLQAYSYIDMPYYEY